MSERRRNNNNKIRESLKNPWIRHIFGWLEFWKFFSSKRWNLVHHLVVSLRQLFVLDQAICRLWDDRHRLPWNRKINHINMSKVRLNRIDSPARLTLLIPFYRRNILTPPFSVCVVMMLIALIVSGERAMRSETRANKHSFNIIRIILSSSREK